MPHTVLLVPINVSTLQSKRGGCKMVRLNAEQALSLPPLGS